MAALESQHFLDNSRKRVNPMRLVILDRDGVINRDSDAYIKSAEEWEALPGSLKRCQTLQGTLSSRHCLQSVWPRKRPL